MKEAGIPICIDEHQIGGSESVLVAPMGTEQLGVYIGEGMTAVPKRLAEKIWRWEFVDMGELLPDGWAQGKSEEGAGSSLALTRMKRQVTDVNTWVQCFAVYTSVHSRKHPEVVPELLAYMVSIMKAGSKYAGLAWVLYDSAYRRQAASTENRKWSSVNPSLYSVCFTGKALSGPRCSLCASAEHVVRDCPFSTKSDIERTLEAVMTVCAPRASGVGSGLKQHTDGSVPEV